jgi:DNA-binding MarR family transcriptional regulator
MHRAAREVVALVEKVAAVAGLTAAELDLLEVLVDQAPCTIAVLLRESGYRPSTLTSVLDRLASRGWVSRDTHPGDRRSFVVSLTPDGRRAARTLELRLAPLEREVGRRIPRADVEVMLRLPARLEVMARALKMT